MKYLRAFRQSIGTMMVLLLISWQIGLPLQAATFYWDADADATGNTTSGTNLGGTGIWNTSLLNWWDGTAGSDQLWNNTNDAAIFGGTAGTVTLGTAITAGELQFKTKDYTLTGSTLALTGTGNITADLGTYATIASQLNGTNGLTLAGTGSSGRGAVKLTNAGNNYTGTTTINGGTLIIDSNGALGTDTSTVMINEVQAPGLLGGSLMLAGNTGASTYGTGFTVLRNLSIASDVSAVQTSPLIGAAILSVGNNTISGLLTAAPATLGIHTGVTSAFGTLTLSNVSIGGTAATNFTTFGSTSSIGGYKINGTLAGTGSIQKAGFGTLILAPTDATGFSGTLQVSAGSVRVTDTAALGTSAATNAIDLNGGLLEMRADSTAFTSAKRINLNNGSGATDLFLDRGIGGTGLNQTFTFANYDYDGDEAFVINSRNGYGATFTAATALGNSNTAVTVTNNGNGLVTYGGTLWGQSSSSANSLTINGTGNTLVTGSITATGGLDTFVKSGTGIVTVQGAAGTYLGATTVSAGTLAVTDFRSFNLASTAAINLGATTAAGTLNFGTTTASTAAGLTSAVNGTTLLSAAFAAGVSTITLQSTAGLVAGSAISGTGIAPGTTVASVAGNVVTLSTPTSGAGTVSQVITAANVTNVRVINLAGTTGGATINANQAVAAPVIIAAPTPTTTVISASGAGIKTLTLGGTSTQVNTVNGAIVDNTGTNTTSLTKADLGTWQLAGVNTYTGTTTITAGLLKIKANAAASTIVADASAITFNANAVTSTAGGTLEFTGISGSATTETLGALTATAGAGTIILTSGGGGSAANLTFTSLGATTAASSVNFVTTAGGGGLITLTGQAATTATTLPGTANFLGHLYVNGADFAAINASAQVITPTYGTTAGFVLGGAALTAANHNIVNAAIASQAAVAVTSLKMTTFNLTLAGNLTLNTGALLQTGGSVTIDGTAAGKTILGGAAGTNIAIRVNGSSDTLTLTSNVTIGSAQTGGLTKNGAGKLIIQGANAQTGAVTINEGRIELSGTAARLAAAAGVATVIRQGSFLDFNTSVAFTASPTVSTLDGAGTISNIGSADVTFIQTGAGTFTGIFQETGTGKLNVSKIGTTGAPTWNGLSTYTGVTTIGGTTGLVSVLTLANIGTASSIGRGDFTNDTTNAASLVFAGTTGGLNYTGTTSVTIDRLFTLNGSAAGSGAQIANASANNSTLIFSKTNAISFGAGATVAQTLTLGGASTGDNLMNLQIINNAALATSVSKIGAGLWILGNSSNSYSGTTQIGVTTAAGGVLQATIPADPSSPTYSTDPASLSYNSPLLLGGTTGGGVFQTSGTLVRNVSATLAANTVTFNSTLTTGGVGFAAADSKLVVALGGLAAPTALTWGSGGFMGVSGTSTGAFVLSSSTALSEIEIRNAINLNGANRTIQVDDNTTTFTDFATITGVISNSTGTGGIIKTGAGMLQLLADNTYNGSTAVTAGMLVVTSLGNSATPGLATSVGTSTGANLIGQGVILGNATTTGGILVYVGAGETSDRYIGFTGTTAAGLSIIADGSGALVLTNVNNNTAGSPLGPRHFPFAVRIILLTPSPASSPTTEVAVC